VGSGPTSSPVTSVAPPTSSPIGILGDDWPEYHGGPQRTGLGAAEPALGTPKLAWNVAVDGAVYASPLIVAGHVIVATENNSVYALDLFSGAAVWKTHLGAPVVSSTLPCGNISPVSGITGTPAADPASGRLYVVAFLSGFQHVMFTLNLIDGSVIGQRTVDPVGSNPSTQQQRGALAIASGYVYVTLGGLFGDCGDYHGYVAAMPQAGGTALAYRTPVAREAGIWSPAGATFDPTSGSVYVATGNGEPTSTFGYSNSVIEFSSHLQVQSYFAPTNWGALDSGDVDLGSLGVTVLPSQGLVLAAGKEGVAYLLRAGKLGGIGGQIASLKVCDSAFGGTARSADEKTVWMPCTGGLVALSVSAGSITVAWRAARPRLGSPILAAGALWAVEPDSATLFALDPATGAVLYSLSIGAVEHFSTPAATTGFVVAPAGTHVIALSTAA
jgi:polyvinyl alcohol dehydrogenase (cytochrome)